MDLMDKRKRKKKKYRLKNVVVPKVSLVDRGAVQRSRYHIIKGEDIEMDPEQIEEGLSSLNVLVESLVEKVDQQQEVINTLLEKAEKWDAPEKEELEDSATTDDEGWKADMLKQYEDAVEAGEITLADYEQFHNEVFAA